VGKISFAKRRGGKDKQGIGFIYTSEGDQKKQVRLADHVILEYHLAQLRSLG